MVARGRSRKRIEVVVDEVRLFRIATTAIAVADDAFGHPEPGTSAGHHLASGLIPIAIALGALKPVKTSALLRARPAQEPNSTQSFASRQETAPIAKLAAAARALQARAKTQSSLPSRARDSAGTRPSSVRVQVDDLDLTRPARAGRTMTLTRS